MLFKPPAQISRLRRFNFMPLKSCNFGRSTIILLAGMVAVYAWAQSPKRSLAIKYGDAEQKLTFNPNLLSEDQVRRFAKLSPHVSEYTDLDLSPALELCIAGRPEYLECGSRDLHDKNFYRNAQINLKKGREALRYLADQQYPPELKPVFDYFNSSLNFSLWREQARLDFYKSWNTDVLRSDYQDLKPTALCASVLEKIDSASSRDERYGLAKEWSNCLVRARPQSYPEPAWQNFLKAYGMTEEYVEEDDNE